MGRECEGETGVERECEGEGVWECREGVWECVRVRECRECREGVWEGSVGSVRVRECRVRECTEGVCGKCRKYEGEGVCGKECGKGVKCRKCEGEGVCGKCRKYESEGVY